MSNNESEKLGRVLDIYTRLKNGCVINKEEEIKRYSVTEKSIRRDINEIRTYLSNSAEDNNYLSLVYDKKEKGYRLQSKVKLKFDGAETLAVCKILLDSRSLDKTEMHRLLERIVDCCSPKEQSTVKEMIKNELFYYVPPQHKTDFTGKMWEIAKAIQENRYIDIDYKRNKDGKFVKRRLMPVAICFSEYYFYLTAFMADKEMYQYFDVINDAFPTIYRIDRIKKLKVCSEKFSVPYKDRFQEGEFRKRIQFMYGGKLQKVQFTYTGNCIETVLDRLPTAKIISSNDKQYIIKAEVFGNGIDMWIASQGDAVSNVKFE